MLKRKEYLDKGFGDKSALLFYNSNGGEGAVHNYTIAEIGDSVIAAALEQGDENRLEAPEGFEFAGWNTKADGSGTMFQIGEKVLLSQSVTTLYAIWKKIPPAAYAPGDIDNDKNISSADARLALRAAVNLENYAPDSPEFAAADVNGSGAIDVADARLILRAAVGLEKLS